MVQSMAVIRGGRVVSAAGLHVASEPVSQMLEESSRPVLESLASLMLERNGVMAVSDALGETHWGESKDTHETSKLLQVQASVLYLNSSA
jgi:hypothetical protein